MNELEAEVTFLRKAMAHKEHICIVTTCRKTFKTHKVYAHIREATDDEHKAAAAAFEYWCSRCDMLFSRECDLTRHLTASHPGKRPHENFYIQNKPSTARSSKQPSKPISKAIPVQSQKKATEKVSENSSAEEKPDNDNEQREQPELISDSINNQNTQCAVPIFQPSVYANRQPDVFYSTGTENYGSLMRGNKPVQELTQEIPRPRKTGSVPEEQRMTNSYLLQYDTTPSSMEVSTDSGTDSGTNRQHMAHPYLSQYSAAPTSIEVSADSDWDQFSKPPITDDWYGNSVDSDWRYLVDPERMNNWYQSFKTSDWDNVSYLPQYDTTPSSMEVSAGSGTNRQHMAHPYLSRYSTAPTSMEVSADSDWDQFSKPPITDNR